jgi:geranyl diphosphate 2-C-methyltransferase
MPHTGFPAGHYDAVVTNETTMFLDLFELYGEFATIVRPGGRLSALIDRLATAR